MQRQQVHTQMIQSTCVGMSYNSVSPLCSFAACSGRSGGAAAAAVASRPLFYKVPFQAVPDLVGSRRVLLRAGQAYVGEDQVRQLTNFLEFSSSICFCVCPCCCGLGRPTWARTRCVGGYQNTAVEAAVSSGVHDRDVYSGALPTR